METTVVAQTRPRPSWIVRGIMLAFRTFLLTLLWTAAGMGVGLFAGILIALIVTHGQDMTFAYKRVAIPLALTSGSLALLWNLVRVVRDVARERRERRTE